MKRPPREEGCNSTVEAKAEKVGPRVHPTFSPDGNRRFPCRSQSGDDRDGLSDVDGHEGAAGVYALLHAEDGAHHDLGDDSREELRPRRESDEAARDGRSTRRSSARTNGRGDEDSPTLVLDKPAHGHTTSNGRSGAYIRMPASDSTPPEGKRTSGASFWENIGRRLLRSELERTGSTVYENFSIEAGKLRRGEEVDPADLLDLYHSVEQASILVQDLYEAAQEAAEVECDT